MPHLVILYSGQLDQDVDMGGLCRQLADNMLTIRAEDDSQVFPTGGTRVLAYPAPHYAVATGPAGASAPDDYGFIYLNLRMGRGRSDAVKKNIGESLAAATREYLAPLLARRKVGVTLQIDKGNEHFDAKLGNLHDVFRKPGQ